MDEKTKTLIKRAMWRTWEVIASDIFQARADCGEEGPMPRDEVIEVVLDANHVETHGFGHRTLAPEDQEAKAAYTAMSPDEQEALAKEVFDCKRYS